MHNLSTIDEMVRSDAARHGLKRKRSDDMKVCPAASDTMELCLQSISGDEPRKVEVPISASLANLRATVCDSLACEPWSFSLVLGGVKL